MRSRLLLLFAAFFALVVVVVALPAAGEPGRVTVAVLRFENNTGDVALAWLGGGIAETLTTEFAAADRFRVVERAQIEKVVEELRFGLSGLVDPATAQELGRILGARYVIGGGYQRFAGMLRIDARRIDTASGEVLETTSVTGPEAELFTLQERLARQLMERILASSAGG